MREGEGVRETVCEGGSVCVGREVGREGECGSLYVCVRVGGGEGVCERDRRRVRLFVCWCRYQFIDQ